jgi:peptide/nickel transport system permease protein
MNYGRLAVRRLLSGVLVLLASTVLIFLVVSLSGNPLAQLLDRQPPVPASVIEQERERLGLNYPIPVRYVRWLWGVLHGDFGPSVLPATSIGHEIGSRILVTLWLVVASLVIASILAVAVGVLSALLQYSVFDHLATGTGYLFLAMPSFWLAVLLKQAGIWANTKAGSIVFYTVGSSSIPPPSGVLATIGDVLGHLILPTLTLILVHYAAWSRYQRSAMLETLGTDYVRFAVMKGLSRRAIILRHALRPALIPIVTIIALDTGALLSGSIITETVFQWNGLGAYLLQSIQNNDTNAIMAWLLVAAGFVIVCNLLADVVIAAIDPRVRRADTAEVRT